MMSSRARMRPAIVVLLIALCAACAGGCGGDSSGSTTAPEGTASAGSEASVPRNGAAPGQEGSTHDSNGDEATQDGSSSGATSEGGDSSEGTPSGHLRHHEADLPHRGQVSANSAPFRSTAPKASSTSPNSARRPSVETSAKRKGSSRTTSRPSERRSGASPVNTC